MLSPFKRQVARDARWTFMDPGAFADEHEVEGRDIMAVLDESVQGARDMDMGLPSATHRLFARTRDLPRRKRPGATLTVDGIPYMVESWREDMGVADIALVRAQ